MLFASALINGIPICEPTRLSYISQIERIAGSVRMILTIGPGKQGPCALVFRTRRHIKFVASGEGLSTTVYVEAPEKRGVAQYLDKRYQLVGYIRVDNLSRMHGNYRLTSTLMVSPPYVIPFIEREI